MKKNIIILVTFIVSWLNISAQEISMEEVPVQVSHESSWGAGSIAGFVLGLIAIVGIIFTFLKLIELKKEFSGLAKSNSASLKGYGIEIQTLNQELKKVKDLIAKQSVAVTGDPNHSTSRITRSSVMTREIQEKTSQNLNNADRQFKNPEMEEKKNQTLYVGSPRDNVFVGSRRTFTPGQSLYQINDRGAATAEYSIANRKEAIMVALRSITDFIEPGCSIDGEPSMYPSSIITITPGIVRRNGNSWIIEKKATVKIN